MPVLDQVQIGVLSAELFAERRHLLVAELRGVQGRGAVSGTGIEALDDLFLVDPQVSGELGGGGRPAQPLCQLVAGPDEFQPPVAEPPGHPYPPGSVTEEALDLPGDGGDRERQEAAAL